MTLEEFIIKYNTKPDGPELSFDRDDREEAVAAAIAELAALRERVATARLEGARAAWLIAHAEVEMSEYDGLTSVITRPPFFGAREAYRDAFGEEAPE